MSKRIPGHHGREKIRGGKGEIGPNGRSRAAGNLTILCHTKKRGRNLGGKKYSKLRKQTELSLCDYGREKASV